MVKDSTYLTRCKAVAQLEGGKTQSEVARGIGVSIRTVKRWWKKHQTGQELTKTPGRGRKPKLSKEVKITISKSLTKSAQLTCKLAARLTSKGHKVSHETVLKHMRQSLKVLPFKPPAPVSIDHSPEGQPGEVLQGEKVLGHWRVEKGALLRWVPVRAVPTAKSSKWSNLGLWQRGSSPHLHSQASIENPGLGPYELSTEWAACSARKANGDGSLLCWRDPREISAAWPQKNPRNWLDFAAQAFAWHVNGYFSAGWGSCSYVQSGH